MCGLKYTLKYKMQREFYVLNTGEERMIDAAVV
jgi:hypothetical protein